MTMRITLCVVCITILLCGCSLSKKETKAILQTNEWQKEMPGVYKAVVNEPSAFNLLSVANRSPRTGAIEKLGDASVPIDLGEVSAVSEKGKTRVSFPLDQKEQIYGFGLNFKSVQQRGRIMRLHVDHYGGSDNGRTHAPVPFFVSSKGYGVLINAARYIDVYVGTGVNKNSKNPPVTRDRNTDSQWDASPYSDRIEMLIPEDGVEMVLFTGKSMMDVVRRFNLYCGGGVLPPKWGLGFWHRTPTLYNAQDVQTEIAGFAKENFPLDVIGLEPGWHSKAYPCSFEWSEERFPQPDSFVANLQQQGVKVNLWMNPYLWPDGTVDKQMKAYTGSHTVWCGTVPDYTIPEARKVMQDHMVRNQLEMGVSGYKMDEVDGFDSWLWPDVATFPSGKDGEQMRQTYGLQMMRLTDEIYRAKNERTYGLIRAANAGSVSYPYVIYNDYYSHRDFITALINSGFSGLLWTPEVRASESSEEWVRRMQTVCFSPLAMINAWADGTKPWSFPEVYKACQDVAMLRMQLLPYLYSSFAQYYFEGTPPFRAMNLVEGFGFSSEEIKGALSSSENPYAEATHREVKDQYMVGDNLLVAPLFAGESERKVILPKGKWFDFYTGKLAGDGEIITVAPGLDRIPLFVRDGGIIPMIPAIRQTRDWTNLSLEVRIYGEADGSFTLYDDDGKTFDFEKGNYTTKEFSFKNGEGTVADKHSAGPWAYSDVKWLQMTK